jgi:hypothetical protein
MAMRRALRLSVLLVASTFLLTPLAASVGEQPAFAQKKRSKKKPPVKKRSTPPAKKAPPPVEQPKGDSDLVPAVELRGPTRLDFDDRLIQGQTNKSGAVYLFDRKDTGISSMVKRRKTFRQLTIRTVYDR